MKYMKILTTKRTTIAALLLFLSTGALAGNGGDIGIMRASRVTANGNGGDIGIMSAPTPTTTEVGK